MGSSKHAIASLERRVRRVARRYGLSLLKAARMNPKILEHGGYMLRDDETFAIVFGDKEYEFSADIDEVEAFLDAQGKGEED